MWNDMARKLHTNIIVTVPILPHIQFLNSGKSLFIFRVIVLTFTEWGGCIKWSLIFFCLLQHYESRSENVKLGVSKLGIELGYYDKLLLR